ncbi:MAG: hypothetical protein P8Q38_07030 [Schleiferiaceae bacterium]|jgi:hypothetical protein|nr:hypothetical protein [Schleiferiaceae bacterium]MDG1903031.1 hypothetical protein [Schleiferiaceae bacterium]
MRKSLLLLPFVILFASCETQSPTETNTERFYKAPWNVALNRSHGAVGQVSAANEDHSGSLTLSKQGWATFDISLLSDHMHQQWGYSWSTDEFFMNWAPCLEWYINEAEDSMYLNYDHQDYDPNSGNSFYWNYDLILTR